MKFPAIPAIAAALFFLLPFRVAAQEDPEAVYGKFHRALIAGNVDEMNKYGTPGGAAELAKMPAEQRKGVLELMKKFIPATYTITAKEPGADPNHLTMHATAMIASPFDGKPQPTMGTILMVKMGNEWKVDESNWDSPKRGAAPTQSAPQRPPVPARTATTGVQRDAEAVLGKVHNAFKAANYDELKKYSTPYSMRELAKMDPEKRKGVLAFLYMLLPPDYKITDRELSPDGNRLTLRATGKLAAPPGAKPEQANGVIGMVKQDGAWKVDTEEWKNAGPAVDAGRPVQAPVPAPKAAARIASQRQAAAVKATPAPTAPEPVIRPAKEPCVYKPIMTDVDMERCR